MRILQICMGFVPRRLARNGGELRFWQNLASLVALGHEVHLVVIQNSQDASELETEVKKLPRTVHYLYGLKNTITKWESWRALISREAALRFYLYYNNALRNEIANLTRRIQPDLIWADWLGAMALVPKGLPIVYSHSDFYYKILSVRRATQGKRFRWPDRVRQHRLRNAELALCEKASHVVCASYSEKRQLEGISRVASYIPIVGPSIQKQSSEMRDNGRVFLFGTWACTAMRSAAKHFRKELWPLLDGQRPPIEWHQVGKPEPQKTEDWQWVEKTFNCHGYIDDLSQVFYTGDASLVPYPEDTGFRTKFVTAAAYGVINIGYKQAFHCVPEFTPEVDCLVAESPFEMVCLLRQYGGDLGLRRRLGEASRALYEKRFLFEAQFNKYEEVLNTVAGATSRNY
jgi:glycosyltransferase involved in cell wall biosynthesis